MPQSMGFPATDWGSSLEVQRYYGGMMAWYWLSIHAGCLDRLHTGCVDAVVDRMVVNRYSASRRSTDVSTEDKTSFKVAFVRFDSSDFQRLLDEHYVNLPGISFSDLVDLDFVVMCGSHIPEWVVKIEEIVLPRSSGSAKARVSEARSVVGIWATKEVNEAFTETYHHFDGVRTVLTEFPSDRLFTVGNHVQLRAKTAFRGALSLEMAVEEVAATYRVKPSQVKIVISSEG